ncbi:hypothetical protein [Neolewinella persica]|uniref:hypothetical protein n=1 Tax=Neolewinella persica TaxID=70998 RepID=UPI000364BABE|nr:hypothetical protein [Neolewinella persica]
MKELENSKLKAAITTLQRPDLLSKRLLQGEPIKERTYSFPAGMTKEEGAELMIAIATVTAVEDEAFGALYERARIQEKQRTVRSGETIEIIGQAYQFLHDHWGEIAFFVEVLDRRKAFDKLKEKSKNWKAIFGTILEEEEDKEDESEEKPE